MALKSLTNTGFPSLVNFDRESIVDELLARMKQMPGWNNIYSSLQYQDSSQFIIQLFAYLTEKIALSANKNIRENFLTESFSDRAIYNNLNEMKIVLKQNTAASVQLFCMLQSGSFTKDIYFDKFQQITCVGLNSSTMPFEIINYSDGSYDYTNPVVISAPTYPTRSFFVTAYAGTTNVDTYTLGNYDLENLRLSLSYTNIIDDSIEIYYSPYNNSQIKIKLKKVVRFTENTTSEIDSEYIFTDGIPAYIISYGVEGTVNIAFGSAQFGNAFPASTIGGQLFIYSRSGGGSASNVAAGAINGNMTVTMTSDDLVITAYNRTAAFGGSDKETLAEAKTFGPNRYGRDTIDILKTDIEEKFRKIVVKDYIETPVYSESGDVNVPLLHCYHYIVPIRQFVDLVIDTYNLTTYEELLDAVYKSVNDFCSVKGNNQIAIKNEFAGWFTRDVGDSQTIYDFTFTLANIRPFSGSIVLNAFDSNDILVDSTTWDSNYILDAYSPIKNSANTEHSIFESDAFTSAAIITTSSAAVARIGFGADTESFYSIPFENNVSYSVEMLIEYMNARLKQIIINEQTSFIEGSNNLASFTQFDFFEPVWNADKTLVKMRITDVFTGSASAIYITKPNDGYIDAWDYFKITQKAVYTKNQTEFVFNLGTNLDSSTYIHNTGQIKVGINSRNIENQKLYYEFEEDDHKQSVSQQIGPVIKIPFFDNKWQRQIFAVDNETINVEITGANGTEQFEFTNAVSEEVNSLTKITSGESIYLDSDSTVNNADLVNGVISLQLKDGVQIPFYSQSYPIISQIKIYQNSNFSSAGTYDTSNEILFAQLNESDSRIISEPYSAAPFTQNVTSSIGPVFFINIDFSSNVRFVGNVKCIDNYGNTFYQDVSIMYLNNSWDNDIRIPPPGRNFDGTMTIQQAIDLLDPAISSGMVVGPTSDIAALKPNTPSLILSKPNNETTYYRVTLEGHNDQLAHYIFLWSSSGTSKWEYMPESDLSNDINGIAKLDGGTQFPSYITQNMIEFRLKDPEVDTNTIAYDKGYADIDTIMLTYTRKTYDYILANYTPNPYLPQNEAKNYINLIKQKESRLIALEHLIRNMNYVPIGGNIKLYVTLGNSGSAATDAAYDLIIKYFSYNNTNSNHVMGTVIDDAAIKQLLNSKLYNYGISKIETDFDALYVDYTQNFIDNTYFFIPDLDFIDKVTQIETNNNITGLSDLFRLTVTYEYVR